MIKAIFEREDQPYEISGKSRFALSQHAVSLLW